MNEFTEVIGWPNYDVKLDPATEADLSLIRKFYFVNDNKLRANGVRYAKTPTNILYVIPNRRPGEEKRRVKIDSVAIKTLARSKKFVGINEINLDAILNGFDELVVGSDNIVDKYPKGITGGEQSYYNKYTNKYGVKNPCDEFGSITKMDAKDFVRFLEVMDELAAERPGELFCVVSSIIRDHFLDVLITRPFAVENYHLASYLLDAGVYGTGVADKHKIYAASYKDFYRDYAKRRDSKQFLSYKDLLKMELYHISPNHDLKSMEPRVPSSKLSYENAVTKRICFAPTLAQCVNAIPPSRRSGVMSVYVPIITPDTTGFKPSKTQVSDVGITGEIWLTTDVKLKKIGIINLDKNTYNPQLEPVPATEAITRDPEATKLTSAERNALPDSAFGLPDQRKYPLHDAAHVRQAIKFFNYCKPEDRAELAKNIIKAAKKHGVELSTMDIGPKNVFSKYMK